jgi:hypothetical protein
MPNVSELTQSIQAQLANIARRNSQKLAELSTLPPSIQAQLDTQVFSDMRYLLQYIDTLHSVMHEWAESANTGAETFDFE